MPHAFDSQSMTFLHCTTILHSDFARFYLKLHLVTPLLRLVTYWILPHPQLIPFHGTWQLTATLCFSLVQEY